MNENELIQAIVLALPGDMTNKEIVAKSLLYRAITKLGRMDGPTFNQQPVEFSFRANVSKYVINKDILPSGPTIVSVQEIHRRDKHTEKIEVHDISVYKGATSGSTTSGEPRIATYWGNPLTLEVYPVPDATYPVVAICKREVKTLAEIPSNFGDVLVSMAIELAKSVENYAAANDVSQRAQNDVRDETHVSWSGTEITTNRQYGISRKTKSDSGNLLAQ